MRKSQINPVFNSGFPTESGWLNLETIAQIEFTSEATDYPVEGALQMGSEKGWRSAFSGTQSIRILFDIPQKLSTIYLLFEEDKQTRTQEFVIRWLPYGTNSFIEIVRQQYTFSPPNTIRELEKYQVVLEKVSILELEIIPDISSTEAFASLKELRIGSSGVLLT